MALARARFVEWPRACHTKQASESATTSTHTHTHTHRLASFVSPVRCAIVGAASLCSAGRESNAHEQMDPIMGFRRASGREVAPGNERARCLLRELEPEFEPCEPKSDERE